MLIIRCIETLLFKVRLGKFPGNQLWVLKLTAANQSAIGTPNMKLIGNMHGNEAVSREVLLHFVEVNNKIKQIQFLTTNNIFNVLFSNCPGELFAINVTKTCLANSSFEHCQYCHPENSQNRCHLTKLSRLFLWGVQLMILPIRYRLHYVTNC